VPIFYFFKDKGQLVLHKQTALAEDDNNWILEIGLS
jgi:hypothetical protein